MSAVGRWPIFALRKGDDFSDADVPPPIPNDRVSMCCCGPGAYAPVHVCGGVQAGLLQTKLSLAWQQEQLRAPDAPKLRKALWKAFRDVFYIFVVLQVFKSAVVLGQTQCLAGLLAFLSSGSGKDYIGCVLCPCCPQLYCMVLLSMLKCDRTRVVRGCGGVRLQALLRAGHRAV